MNKFEGIVFALKKRQQYLNKADKANYDYVMFGYYDGLLIACVDKWYKLRPAGIADLCGYVKPDEPFADIYVIKGFFPNVASEAFDYKFWREIDQKEQSLAKVYPYICISAIHLSKSFVSQSSGLEQMTKNIIDYIEQVAIENEWNLREVHCAVFPIIGFSDYIIAFAANDFMIPTYIISRLREWKIDGNATVSNCYTLCGVHKNFKVTKDNYNLKSNVRLTAEFSLREGVSAKEFHLLFKEKLINKLEELEIEPRDREAIEKELESYYITFGNVDTLIEPNVNIENYLSVFLDDDFQPNGPLYSKYITGTKTRIRIREEMTESCEKEGAECGPETDDETPFGNIRWAGLIDDFEEELKKRNYAVRMARAIGQIVQNYYNIANTSHGFDIRSCLDGFINVTLEDIKVCWENEKIDWNEVCVAVKTFRHRVGDFVADLLRSDKPFIEGNTLSHPAIGSATKILFAYTAILNNLATQFIDNNHKIVFLVVSGGADATNAIDLFAFLKEEDIGKRKKFEKPVIIAVPEKGLYDIKGTLFRMIHEFMHFCGKRNRIQRYKLMLDIMADIMANDIVSLVFGEQFIDEYLSNTKMYLTLKTYEDLRNETQKFVKRRCSEIKERIKQAIKEYSDFVEYYNIYKEEKDYYETVLFSSSIQENRHVGILSVDNIAHIWFKGKNSLCEKIEKILVEEQVQLYDGINEILQDREVRTYAGMIRANRLKIQSKKQEDVRFGMLLKLYAAYLVGNYNTNGCVSMECWYDYDSIAKMGFRAMVESRSDYLAIRLLDMDVVDYLLSFIYEEKEIARVMPETLDNVFRVGAVLKVGFNISKNNLLDAVSDKIINKAMQIKEYGGYEYEDERDRMETYLKEYVNIIVTLLTEYENERWNAVSKDVEEYLQIFSSISIEGEQVAWLKNFYRICDMTNKEHPYQTLNYLFQQWEQLTRDKDDVRADNVR